MKYLVLIILFFLLTSCEQKPQVRQYTEVIIDAPQAQLSSMVPPMMAAIPEGVDPHAGLDMSNAPMMPTANDSLEGKLAWDLPKGWQQQPGQGMRLVSFHLINDPEAIDVSIISLGGMAGGLQANLKRWLGQINVDVDDEALTAFIKASADNIFDFTQLQENTDSANKSMIAAMLMVEDATVFVKMTGSIKAVAQYKKDFLNLVKSVQLK